MPETLDGVVDGFECAVDFGVRERLIRFEERGSGAKKSSVGSREEDGRTRSERSQVVSAGLRHAFDQTMQPEPAEVVGHHARGHLLGRTAEERCDVLAQVTVGEASGQETKREDCREKRDDTGLSEA